MKKLDEVDRRLEASIEKEEIQTLGLKLRFYYNEIKHYRQLLGNVFNRICESQEKYGFISEGEPVEDVADFEEELKDEPEATAENADGAEAPPPRKAASRAAGAKSREELVGMVASWIRELDSRGVNVEDILLKPKKIDEIMAAGAEGSKEKAASGEDASGAEAEEASGTATVEIPLEVKESFEENGHTAEGADAEQAPAEKEPVSAPRDVPSGAGYAPKEEGKERLPLAQRLSEWENAIEKGEMDEVVDGMEEYVREHRQECYGFISSGSTAAVGRADSSAKTDFLCGLLAMLLGSYGSAINMLESSLRKAGAPSETRRILAGCYFQKGLYENALANYRESMSAGARKEESTIEASDCLLRLGKFEEVIEFLSGAEFSDHTCRLHAGIRTAEALLELNRHNEALEKAGLLLDECETPTERSFCYHLLARAKEAKKDYVSAIDLYERSLENDSMNAPARLGLGKLCMQNNALPLAKNHFSFIARNFPESEWADEARRLLYNVAEIAANQNSSKAAAQTQTASDSVKS
ncbi:MAG: hypothetical protein ABIH66_00585 [bacterium]